MKIGIVCYPTYGGSGVVATELGKALAEKGHHVHFITYSKPARLSGFHTNIFFHEVSFQNYSLFEYPPYEAALSSKMVDVVQFEKLDLLHVHYAIPHASAAYLAKQILKEKKIPIPIITTLHGTDITLVGKNSTFSPVVTFSINASDGITTVSNSLKKDTYAHFGINKEIRVIPNFIDLNRFKRKPHIHFKKTIAPNNEKILIHVSNFRKVKRVQDTILILKHIREASINAKLLLIGDGPDRAAAEQLCRELNVCPWVSFLGKQDAVEELLSIADIFLMPSENESFGLAALEAMACGVPVISSNIGGIPEINIDGKTGFLCPAGDTQTMAKRAIRILSEDTLMMHLKENARKQAEQFNIHHILTQYETYYQTILATHYA